MKKLIGYRFAVNASLLIYALFTVFHLSIIFGMLFFDIAPIQFLWGGRMQTKEQLLVFEIISLAVQFICIFLTLVRFKYISMPGLMNISKAAMWVLFVLFLLNTLGNIFAKTNFEKYLAIVTALLSIFSLRIAIEK